MAAKGYAQSTDVIKNTLLSFFNSCHVSNGFFLIFQRFLLWCFNNILHCCYVIEDRCAMQYGKIIIQEAQTVQYAEIALFYTDKW